MCLAPLHYLAYLVPVVYLLVFHKLNTGAPVIIMPSKYLSFYIVKGLVKFIQMTGDV